MATSSQPNPQGTPFTAGFKQSINLDNVAEKVYPFDNGPAPHLSNSGLLRDDGVTNVYATTYDGSASYDQVWYAPNGKKVSIKWTGSTSGYYVDDVCLNKVILSSDSAFGLTSKINLPYGAIDFAITTTGTWLILSRDGSGSGGRAIVREYDPTTETVINSRIVSSGASSPLYFIDYVFVKEQSMTYSSASVAYIIIFSAASITVGIRLGGGGSGTAFSGAGKPQNYKGISAYANGGTVVIGGIPNNTSMPQSYYNNAPNNYAAWTAIPESSFLWTHESIQYNSTGSIRLTCCGSSLSSANLTSFYSSISITTAGAITITAFTDALAGLTIVPSDTYTGLGFNSGRYKSTIATKFSPFITSRTGGAYIRSTQTVTDYGVKPQSCGAVGNHTFVYAINGIPVQVSVVPATSATSSYGASNVVEYGNIDPQRTPTEWFSNSASYTSFYVAVNTPYGVQVSTYTQNSCQMIPISNDVVQLTDIAGAVIDTGAMTMEYTAGASSPAFISDVFLTGTNSLAWQTTAKYTNGVDYGQVLSTTGSVFGVAGFSSGSTTCTFAGYSGDLVFYQAAIAGTLFANNRYHIYSATQFPTNASVAYVFNSNLPPPIDSVYHQGGIEMLDISALQTVNEADADGFAQYYAGYTLANQYPISYQFFNLFGQLYGFDGQKIYRLSVNGATAAIPEQVAIAQGLRFIANSPTVAAFVSDFDNALYVFTGGANVTKWQEMTGMALVSSGAYSARESSLYLQLADNTILTFRDDLAGSLANAYTSQTIYATDLGTYFVNNATPTQSTLWTYYAGSGTPLTLTWQSGYYGIGRNQYCRVTQWVITLKVADPATTDITVNYKWITGQTSGSETFTYTAGTYVASATGYVRLQYSPTQAEVYGSSFGISCTKKVILYDAVCYYTDGGVAPVVTTNRNT